MNEYDTRGHSELQKSNFSGFRANDMWSRFELWIHGNMAASLSYQMFSLRPESLNELYCETFGLKEVELNDEGKNAQRQIAEAIAAKKELEEKVNRDGPDSIQ